MRYIVTQDKATWLRSYYAVEVDADADNPEGDAKERLFEGDYEFLGFDVECNVEHVDREIVRVEQMDGVPCMGHPLPEYDPEQTQVAALVEAANMVLVNVCNEDAYGPDDPAPYCEFPRDEDGDAWYHDYWALNEALKPFLPKEQA